MAAIAGLLVAAGPRDAGAVPINYTDFSSTAGLTLNGDASQAGNRLRLTSDLPGQAGSAFLSSALSVDRGFSTTFQFQITSAANSSTLRRSDGIAFVMQSDSRGASALGGSGGNIGYADDTGSGAQITPAVVIEFDTHQGIGDPSDSHVGLMLNGTHTSHAVSANTASKLDNGSIWTAQINYDPALMQLSVLLGENAAAPSLLFSYGIDLATQTALGSQVYFGFTAGTGGGYARQDILSWKLDVAEPATFAIVFAGLLARLLVRNRPTPV